MNKQLETIKKHIQFIREYSGDIGMEYSVDFGTPASEEEIDDLESKLEVKLPESYKWFLKNIGSISSPGESSISGKWSNGMFSNSLGCVYGETIIGRKRFKMLPHFVSLSFEDDEYFTCLNTSLMDANRECPVWGIDYAFSGENFSVKDDFWTYLLEYLEIIIEKYTKILAMLKKKKKSE